MSKIIVLGGAGDMGSRAVEDLADTDGVTEVTIADRNITAAEALANRLQGKRAKVRAEAVDATDHGGLVRAIQGHAVAASALGPFYKFEKRLATAAIEAGADYCSICDEWEAAESVLDGLGAAAKKAGRTVVTGLGASPGITNMVVAHQFPRFDKVRKVNVYCYQPLDAGGGQAVIEHMFHIMTGDLTTWRGGKRTKIPACSETMDVEFPKYGRIQLWNMGHSEPVTLPRAWPDLEEVNFFMGYGKGAMMIVKPAQWGLFKSEAFSLFLAKQMDKMQKKNPNPNPGWGALMGELWGEKDGQTVRKAACGIGQMREATGLSLSIGAKLLMDGQLTQKGGAFAPERCLQPGPFLRELRAKGIGIYEDIAMTQPLE